MTVDDEVRQAAAQVMGEPPGFPCADCDFVAASKAGLGQHRRQAHPTARAAKAAPRIAPADELVNEVIDKTVGNLQVLGGYLAILLPHTGIAIAGVPGEGASDPPIVASRAQMAGAVLGQWARRDERVLKALDRFNRLFETSEVVELAAGIGAAVAVDLGAVPADLAIEVGPFAGPNAIRPVQAVIGDVVEYVAAVRAAQAAAGPAARAPDGVAPDGAEVVGGGVEGT